VLVTEFVEHSDEEVRVQQPSSVQNAKMRFRPGSSQELAGGANDAPPDHLVGWGKDISPHTQPHSMPSAPPFGAWAFPHAKNSSRSVPVKDRGYKMKQSWKYVLSALGTVVYLLIIIR